jgi:hypothetical protein
VTQWGLEAIFNPGKRFDEDERRRLEMTREEAGDSSGGRRIDLGSGVVVIPRGDGAAAEDGAGEDGAAEGGAAEAETAKADGGKPSRKGSAEKASGGAAERARARRATTSRRRAPER